MQKNVGIKNVCVNRKASFNYNIEETYEAGMSLLGTEVKSLRAGRSNIKDSFVLIKNGEAFLENAHISPYEHGNIFNHDPLRRRKLLLHKREIDYLTGKVQEKGYSLVPLSIYFVRGKAKVKVALATGKKLYDKRRSIKEKEDKREISRALKYKQRY